MSKFLRLALIPVVFVALALPVQASGASPATPAEHVVPVGRSVGHRIHLPDHLLSGARLAAAQRPRHGSTALAVGGSTTESGSGAALVNVAPFLTRPYWNHHDVVSVFDHCNPDYSVDGRICEVDGTVAVSSNGSDPTFTKGYAITPGSTNYLYYDGHNGWDIALNYEQLIAAASGTVTIAGVDPNNVGFGNCVVIDHGNGFSTRYGHMSQISVHVGQHVNRAQPIGISGNTGYSTGPHLHFGVYINNPWTAIDPWGWAGNYADPWPADSGDLWLTGNPVNPFPASPANVQASTYDSTATVTWSPPSFDGGDGVSSYVVTASPGGAQASVPGSVTTATVTGLTYGTSYTFTVKAVTDLGTSAPSPASNAVTPKPALGPATNVQAAATFNVATVTWSAPTQTGGHPPTSYTVTASPGGNQVTVPGASTSAYVPGLTYGTSYTFTVSDVNEFNIVRTSTSSNTITPAPTSLGGAAAGAPVVLSSAPGRIDVLTTNTDRTVAHRSGDGTNWQPWESLGGVATSAPAAASWGTNRLDVFVRGSDNALWHRFFDGSWHPWESIGGKLAGAPAVTAWGPNRLDIVVEGTDNRVWHRCWDGSRWHAWESLGGSLISTPVINARASNRLDIFIQGSDHALWYRAWDGTAWTGWTALGGGLASDPSEVSWSSSRIDVVVLGTDKAAWHKSFDSGRWSNWESLGASLGAGPAAVSTAPGSLEVIGLDSGGGIVYRSWNGAGWSAWTAVGETSWTPAYAPFARSGGNVDVFGLQTDGALYQAEESF